MKLKDHIQPIVDVEDHCCGQDCGFFGDDDICSLTEKRRQVKKSYNPALIEAAQAVLDVIGMRIKLDEACICGREISDGEPHDNRCPYQAYLRIAGGAE